MPHDSILDVKLFIIAEERSWQGVVIPTHPSCRSTTWLFGDTIDADGVCQGLINDPNASVVDEYSVAPAGLEGSPKIPRG